MNYKDIYSLSVPDTKRAQDKVNPWLFYIVRPISIFVTIPLIKSRITPIMVTIFSMITTVIGFFLVSFGNNIGIRIVGWVGYFIWAILDCVDGNLARIKGLSSNRGALWDAAGGYLALSLIFFSMGICAFHDNNLFQIYDNYLYIVLGGATSLMSIYPRLIMQKKKAMEPNSAVVKSVTEKQDFSIPKIIAMNLESAIGIIQIIMLVSIILHCANIFVLFYFIINTIIALYSLYLLLK